MVTPGAGRSPWVAVSALGVLNAQLLTGPRLLFALVRDGRFFPTFSRVHASRGTPIPAIVVLAGETADQHQEASPSARRR